MKTVLQPKKKMFVTPKIEVIDFLSEDILVTSSIPPIFDNDDDSKHENMDSNGWT